MGNSGVSPWGGVVVKRVTSPVDSLPPSGLISVMKSDVRPQKSASRSPRLSRANAEMR